MWYRTWLRLVALLILSSVALGCGGAMASGKSANESGMSEEGSLQAEAARAPAAPPQPAGMPGSGEMMAQAPAPPSARGRSATDAAGPAQPTSPPVTTGSQDPAPDKARAPLLIYEANVTLAIFEVTQSLDKVEKLVKEAGGYLVNRSDRAIVVRVPAAEFEAILGKVLELGDVLSRNVHARDVTDEFFDLQTRLKNAEAFRARLSQLLERAKDVNEALQVEQQLARVTGEIEQLKGRLKLLGELIAFSTITVNFQAPQVEKVDSSVELPFEWLRQLGLGNLLRF